MFIGRKVLKIAIVLIILLGLLSNIIYADDENEEEINDVELQEIVQTSINPIDEPIINSKAAIVFDRTSKRVLYSKNENSKRTMASTTKIMTAIIVIENKDLNDVVTISKKAANTGGSRLKLNSNDKITANDLLYGLMLKSRK